MRPYISVITSLYKKDKVGVIQIEKINELLSRKGFDYEFIVVVDGLNIDRNIVARSEVQNFLETNSIPHRILDNQVNMGKGFSIRKGIKNATGSYLLITDADLDIKMSTFECALKALRDNPSIDAVIPSKFHPGSEVNATGYRQIQSKCFQLFTRTLLPTPDNVQDVSCGLKAFRRDVLMDFVDDLVVNRFAIDSEMMYYLNKSGAKVASIPFHTSLGSESTASNPKEILEMVRSILLLSIKVRLLSFSDVKLLPGKRFLHAISTRIVL